MKLGVLKQRLSGERRVAIIPAHLGQLVKLGLEVLVEAGAGEAAGFPDAEYSAKGARIVASLDQLAAADLIASVRLAGAARTAGESPPTIDWQSRHLAIGLAEPLAEPQAIAEFARTGASLFALELIPRITRAQSMDVLSSQATVVGYRSA